MGRLDCIYLFVRELMTNMRNYSCFLWTHMCLIRYTYIYDFLKASSDSVIMHRSRTHALLLKLVLLDRLYECHGRLNGLVHTFIVAYVTTASWSEYEKNNKRAIRSRKVYWKRISVVRYFIIPFSFLTIEIYFFNPFLQLLSSFFTFDKYTNCNE